MPAPDFWAEDAKAMELTLAGTRLIVQEVGDLLRDLWRRVVPPRRQDNRARSRSASPPATAGRRL